MSKLKMRPFVPYRERGRLYRLVAACLSMDEHEIDDTPVLVRDRFVKAFVEVSRLIKASSIDNERILPMSNALEAFSPQDGEGIRDMVSAVFDPLTVEEEVMLRSCASTASLGAVVMALRELSAMMMDGAS